MDLSGMDLMDLSGMDLIDLSGMDLSFRDLVVV